MSTELAVSERSEYLPNQSFQSFLNYLKASHPVVEELIEASYLHDPNFDGFSEALGRVSWEFEADDLGRGGSYNVAQHRHVGNRKSGMAQLLAAALQNGPRIAGRRFTLLDALAGDGTIWRYVKHYETLDVCVISADISSYMIDCCQRQNIPCLRQSATRSLIRDNALDAVLLAYGTHHIPQGDRPCAFDEAHRTLAPGGRLVVHDFAVGSAMDAWFGNVVHPFSHTGHDHPHFTADELQRYCREAGFNEVEIVTMNDPFEAIGDTELSARRSLIEFMHDMYGLDRLPLRTYADFVWLETAIERIFGAMETFRRGDEVVARISREAIVAMATK